MMPWQRRLLWTIEITLLLLGVYFEPTRIVRGTLFGETFYEGRPTSYWRSRIDHWQNYFETQDDALHEIWPGDACVGQLHAAHVKPPTAWERVCNWIRSDENQFADLDAPDVLQGDPSAEPVLRELERDAACRPFVERARKASADGGRPMERMRIGR